MEKITAKQINERVEIYKEELTIAQILKCDMVLWHSEARHRAIKELCMEKAIESGDEIIFIIDTDHINELEHSHAGKTFGVYKGFEKYLTHKFRLYDDDGVLYYEGRASNQDSESAFEPLDWAMSDSGCTEIRYLNNGKWETL